MKYEVIYADPPWRYDFSKSDSREIENQYPTMSVDEICALNVPSEKNAVLYLWATAPKLREALKVMEAWRRHSSLAALRAGRVREDYKQY